MLLLVGLGNPGPEHSRNRHNVGFMAVDAIIHRHSFGPARRRFHGVVSDGTLAGERVLALKPQTYMNRSGISVAEAAHFFRIAPPEVIVIHDEIDLVGGKLRVKRGGGTAGHNGLRDIDAHIGRDFRRVRIGIGHPGVRELVMPYVLSDFAKDEREWLDPLLKALAEAAPLLAQGDDAAFMSRVALLRQPARADRDRADDAAPKI
ncbi:MAG: aminoacyl-tRNA hydrolase [Alphaproteobacteria bacterium]|nr:aminoacyl-tRNA hydrolase [Alphaproteobacteria bacterium]